MPSKKKSSFQCEFCDKICLLRGGLKRHVTKKHPSSKAQADVTRFFAVAENLFKTITAVTIYCEKWFQI